MLAEAQHDHTRLLACDSGDWRGSSPGGPHGEQGQGQQEHQDLGVQDSQGEAGRQAGEEGDAGEAGQVHVAATLTARSWSSSTSTARGETRPRCFPCTSKGRPGCSLSPARSLMARRSLRCTSRRAGGPGRIATGSVKSSRSRSALGSSAARRADGRSCGACSKRYVRAGEPLADLVGDAREALSTSLALRRAPCGGHQDHRMRGVDRNFSVENGPWIHIHAQVPNGADLD